MSPSFDPGFSTDEMSRIFSASSRVRAMCSVEAALAAAEAEAGAITAAAAEEIRQACARQVEDPEAILAKGWESGSPVIVLLDLLRADLSTEASSQIHFGATTQDIVDTALTLQIRDGLTLIEKGLRGITGDLTGLALDHRSTLMMGRTFGQNARPTTFGLRAAQWLDPIARHVVDADETATQLPVQLGGPVGNLSELGDAAAQVTRRMAVELGLQAPTLPWHTDRSRLEEVAALLQRIARTMAKIGSDLILLAQTEIGEVRMRAGGSSSMPEKRNPIDAVRAVAAAEASTAAATIVTGGRAHDLERAAGGWHAEWFAFPVVFQTTAAAVEAIGAALTSLEVNTERMAANLGDSPTEGVATTAAVFIDRVIEASMAAVDSDH